MPSTIYLRGIMEPPEFSVPPPGQPAGDSAADVPAKADLAHRAVALIIDGVIASLLGILPVVGGLVGAAYMVVRDGLEFDFMDHRSVGKQLMKLRPVRLDGEPMDVEASIRRNWMFGLGALTTVLLWIPIIGWILVPVVGIAAFLIGLYEIFKVITDEEGRRWGDRLATTRVIESEA